MKSDAREARPPGLAGDCQEARPARARGPQTNTEGSHDPVNSAVLTCVDSGRRVKKQEKRKTAGTGNHKTGYIEGKGGGGTQEKKSHCTSGGHTAQSKQAAPERVGAIGAQDKKRSRRQVTHGSKRQGGENTKDAGGPAGYKRG